MPDPHAANARPAAEKPGIGGVSDWPVLAPAPAAVVTSLDKSPTFSILVAAYQVADVIGEALESAFGQTHPALEVIVCDDGSTDDLERALEPHRGRIVLTRKENGGEGSAKNTAARLANGDYIVILDADDRYLPRRLEALAHLARTRPDLDLLTTDAYLEANGTIVRRCYAKGWTFEVEDQRKAILQRNFVFGHVAVRRELFLRHGGFDESIRRTADWDCWLRMILEGARVGAVMEPLSIYRVRATSLSADRAAMLGGKIGTLEKALVSGALDRGDVDVVRRSLERYRRAQDLESLQATLADGRAGMRPLAAKLAVARDVSLRSRLEAVAALVAPGLVGRAHRRRARRSWVGAGGVEVDRAPAPAPGAAASAVSQGLRRAIRVAVYTDAVEIGGAEISAGHLVTHLPPEIGVTVIGVDADVVGLVARGRPGAAVEIVRRPRRPTDVTSLWAHARTLRRLRPDVVHLNLASPWSCQHALVAAAAVPRARVVAVYQLAVPPFNRRQRWLKRLTSYRVSAHVAVGVAAAREVEAAVGLRRDTVSTIYNAVPDRPPAPSRSAHETATVVAVGRLERQKGFDVLVDAFARLPEGRLLLVGDGSERAALEQQVALLGLEHRVRLTGWIEDPRALLDEADVFALPSRFEGFPLAVVEAMLAGLPLVAADVGSVREAVVEGETGVLVKPDDAAGLAAALQRLLADEAERARLGRAARERALERFVADRMAKAYVDLYRELER